MRSGKIVLNTFMNGYSCDSNPFSLLVSLIKIYGNSVSNFQLNLNSKKLPINMSLHVKAAMTMKIWIWTVLWSKSPWNCFWRWGMGVWIYHFYHSKHYPTNFSFKLIRTQTLYEKNANHCPLCILNQLHFDSFRKKIAIAFYLFFHFNCQVWSF